MADDRQAGGKGESEPGGAVVELACDPAANLACVVVRFTADPGLMAEAEADPKAAAVLFRQAAAYIERNAAAHDALSLGEVPMDGDSITLPERRH